MSWSGYPTQEPCDVCGKVSKNGNQLEPRFYYSVCDDHHSIPPTEVARLREERLSNEKRKRK